MVRRWTVVRKNSQQTLKIFRIYYMMYERFSMWEVIMRHLMSPLDFSVEELDKLMDLANDIEANPQKYAHACEGKKLAT